MSSEINKEIGKCPFTGAGTPAKHPTGKGQTNKDFKNKELSKCPVTGAGTTAKFSAGRGQSNRDFWPNSLNLKI